MKQYKLLALTLGGALMFGGLAPTTAQADSATDIADLKRMVMEMQKAHDAEIATLKQQINNLQKPAQVVDSQGINVSELKQQVESLQNSQTEMEDSLLDKVDVHVSLSQGYLISDKNDWVTGTHNGSFSYNEFAINAGYQISDKLRAGIQLMSRDFGPLMNNKVYVDWAIADYAWRDEVGIRFGRLKTAHGLYNEARDIDAARISIMLPQGVYIERGRDLTNGLDGMGLYGNFDFGGGGALSYQAAVGKRDFDEDGGTARFLESGGTIDEGGISSMEARYLSYLQLDYSTPLDGLRLMGSYMEGEAVIHGVSSVGGVDGADATLDVSNWHQWIASAEYTWEDLIIAGEFRRSRNYKQEFTFEHALAGTTTLTNTVWTEGWYLSSSYRLNDWFAAEAYYSEQYPDSDDKDGNRFTALGQEDFLAWQKDIAISGRFDINDNWIVKAGVTFSDGLAGGFSSDYPAGSDISQNWILYSFKSTVSF